MDIEHGPDVGFIPATNSDAIDTSPNSTSVNCQLPSLLFLHFQNELNQFENELMNVRKTNLHTSTTVNQIAIEMTKCRLCNEQRKRPPKCLKIVGKE